MCSIDERQAMNQTMTLAVAMFKSPVSLLVSFIIILVLCHVNVTLIQH